MNIYDFALEKLSGNNKSIVSLLMSNIKNSEKILRLTNDRTAKLLSNSKIMEINIGKYLEAKTNFIDNETEMIGAFHLQVNKLRIGSNIDIISYSDTNYPHQLRKINSPPLNLYYKGKFTFNYEKSIAIVGTRKVSSYAQEKVNQISRELAEAGFCIISGLAKGVDGQAHRSALAVNKKTMAVLAFMPISPGKVYPAEHAELADEILSNDGALISENILSSEFQRFDFTERNRIISGLSRAVLIVEGSIKSGSFSQYNHAKRQGKLILTLKPARHQSWAQLPGLIAREGGTVIESADDIIKIISREYQTTPSPF